LHVGSAKHDAQQSTALSAGIVLKKVEAGAVNARLKVNCGHWYEGPVVAGTTAVVAGTTAVVVGTTAVVAGTAAVVAGTAAVVAGTAAVVVGTGPT